MILYTHPPLWICSNVQVKKWSWMKDKTKNWNGIWKVCKSLSPSFQLAVVCR